MACRYCCRLARTQYQPTLLVDTNHAAASFDSRVDRRDCVAVLSGRSERHGNAGVQRSGSEWRSPDQSACATNDFSISLQKVAKYWFLVGIEGAKRHRTREGSSLDLFTRTGPIWSQSIGPFDGYLLGRLGDVPSSSETHG